MVNPRKKSKGDTSSSQPPPTENFNEILFMNAVVAASWNLFATKTVITGRRVSNNPSTRTFLIDLLDSIGWKNIIDVPSSVYRYLIRLFYCNITTDIDKSIFYI